MNAPRRHLPSLERLRVLREVARLGGFSAAAKALGLTQPAVSNHVRLLEQQLGTKLLERIGKTARPTREGETLIAASARAFGEIDRALDEVAGANAAVGGPLVLATGATATTHLLPPVMADLTAAPSRHRPQRHDGQHRRHDPGPVGRLDRSRPADGAGA